MGPNFASLDFCLWHIYHINQDFYKNVLASYVMQKMCLTLRAE